MKAVFFSDLHAHAWGQFSTTLPNGRNSRLQHTLDVLEQIRDYCKENSVTHLFMLGDVFHSRTNINVDVFSATWQAFRDLAGAVDHFVILRGNHDSYDAQGVQHSLKAFEQFATVVDEEAVLDLDGCRVGAIGYTPDVDKWKTFAKLAARDLDFFLFHQGITGGTVGAFNIALKAEIGAEDIPTAKATWCLAGHYHKHQWVKDTIGFIGSPQQHSFSERDEPKGFLVSEHGPSGWSRPKQVPSNAPQFHMFESIQGFQGALEAGLDPQKHYVRVKAGGENVAEFSLRNPSVQVEVTNGEVGEQARIKSDVAANDRKLLIAFLESRGVTEHEPLLSIGLSLLANNPE